MSPIIGSFSSGGSFGGRATSVINGLYKFTSVTFGGHGTEVQTGPTLAEARAGISVPIDDNSWIYDTRYFNTLSGIQYWTVPVDGLYRIEAFGASGGDCYYTSYYSGGKGAIMRGDFTLTEGEVIRMALGQRGTSFGSHPYGGNIASGGGGTFVTKTPYYNDTSAILVIAGGGGGASDNPYYTNSGVDASTGTSGTTSSSGEGSNGYGGSGTFSGGGAGFFGDGSVPSGQSVGASSWTNGCVGGLGASSWGTAYYGGFGGGGGGGSLASGGGGGYSGGAAGTWSSPQNGGGGGSYNNGSNQQNYVGSAGNGFVTIEYLG